MKHWTAGWLVVIALAGMPLHAQISEIRSVETPMGLARIEDWAEYPGMTRLLVGDQVVVEPEPDSAQQVVWIEDQVGSLLLVGLASRGNGCYTGYVWVHTAPEENLRATEQFGTCGAELEVSADAETVTVSMNSLNPDEGRLEYSYDGDRVTERVLGMGVSHAGPDASARSWLGLNPAELFAGSDWEEALVSLMGREVYEEAQDVFRLYDPEGMVLSEGWVVGNAYGNTASGAMWGAVAINDDDRRLLVALNTDGGTPRLWGDPNGALPAQVLKVLTMNSP